MMKTIILENNEYELIKDYNNGFDQQLVTDKYTDYFNNYDYVVGDYSYGKLRLKGFYDQQNKNINSSNDIKDVDDYLKKYCSYGCRHFILKKIKEKN